MLRAPVVDQLTYMCHIQLLLVPAEFVDPCYNGLEVLSLRTSWLTGALVDLDHHTPHTSLLSAHLRCGVERDSAMIHETLPCTATSPKTGRGGKHLSRPPFRRR